VRVQPLLEHALEQGLDDSTWEAIVRARESAQLPLRPEFFEKDYLVAEAIAVLARVGRERGARLIFCGGTALSQAHQLIDRMSEDIRFRVVLPELASKTKQRKFPLALKDDLTRAMDEAGFPLDGELRARQQQLHPRALRVCLARCEPRRDSAALDQGGAHRLRTDRTHARAAGATLSYWSTAFPNAIRRVIRWRPT